MKVILAPGPGVYSASNINQYQRQQIYVSGKVKRGRCVGLTSVSRLSRQCGILNISQPYRPARPVMGIALLYWCIVEKTIEEKTVQ
jgi:hypothetical protein